MSAALATRRRAERTAAALPALLVAAQRVAATIQQGVHGRRRPGTGETFWQFRRYEPGDAAAAIDWRQSARTTHVYIREREWEASQSVWLWRDGSPSMEFASRAANETKKERATLILLALAALLLRGGEQVALLGHERRPLRGAAALSRLAESLVADERPDGLPAPTQLPKHAHAVLIGDFLDPLDDIRGAVKGLAGLGVTGHLVHVLDPAEETLPFSGRVRFSGLEGEGPAAHRTRRAGAGGIPRAAGGAAGRPRDNRSPRRLDGAGSPHRSDAGNGASGTLSRFVRAVRTESVRHRPC